MKIPEKNTKWRILFDLNVILDVLMRREPHYQVASQLWILAESGKIDGVVAAHSFTTLFYLYRHQANSQEAYRAIRNLLKVFDVAGIDRSVIEKACDLAWRDFEDAIQSLAASAAQCDFLVTRDPDDYSDKAMTAIQPADLLAIWVASQASED